MALANFKEMQALFTGGTDRKIAVVNAVDEHSVEAAVMAKNNAVAEPVLIGEKTLVEEQLQKAGESPSRFEIVDAPTPPDAAEAAVDLAREGHVHCMLKGAIQTGDLLKAALNRETGIRNGDVLSHTTILEIPHYHKLLSFTDGAMILFPSLEQKVAMLKNSLMVLKGLGYDNPKVGILESNEVPNPKIPSSLEAVRMKEMNRAGEITGCVVEGPISLDLATDERACREKGYSSPVAGDVDLLLFPYITAANAAVKAIQTFGGGAKTAGVVVGAKVPIVLISRASSSAEKFNSIGLAVLMS